MHEAAAVDDEPERAAADRAADAVEHDVDASLLGAHAVGPPGIGVVDGELSGQLTDRADLAFATRRTDHDRAFGERASSSTKQAADTFTRGRLDQHFRIDCARSCAA